jgi:hypothetical protein
MPNVRLKNHQDLSKTPFMGSDTMDLKQCDCLKHYLCIEWALVEPWITRVALVCSLLQNVTPLS